MLSVSAENLLELTSIDQFLSWFFRSIYAMLAVQYQQMGAYGHNVNLLAANANWQTQNCTGSGIYAGRAGALKLFVSRKPTSKVLIAKVPINLPSENEIPNIKSGEVIKEYPEDVIENKGVKPLYDENLAQDQMELFTIRFLDFSHYTNFSGTVCANDFCCNYHIRIGINTNSKVKYGVCILYVNAFYFLGIKSELLIGTYSSQSIIMR